MTKEIAFPERKYSISEVSELCEIKPHTLNSETEFKNLKPITRKEIDDTTERYSVDRECSSCCIKRIYNFWCKEELKFNQRIYLQ